MSMYVLPYRRLNASHSCSSLSPSLEPVGDASVRVRTHISIAIIIISDNEATLNVRCDAIATMSVYSGVSVNTAGVKSRNYSDMRRFSLHVVCVAVILGYFHAMSSTGLDGAASNTSAVSRARSPLYEPGSMVRRGSQ